MIKQKQTKLNEKQKSPHLKGPLVQILVFSAVADLQNSNKTNERRTLALNHISKKNTFLLIDIIVQIK